MTIETAKMVLNDYRITFGFKEEAESDAYYSVLNELDAYYNDETVYLFVLDRIEDYSRLTEEYRIAAEEENDLFYEIALSCKYKKRFFREIAESAMKGW